MKVFKKIICIVILIFFVAVLTVTALMYLTDPNKLKPVLIEEVKKRTGYYLQIDGSLTWAFYPRISIKADHLTLSTQNKSPYIDASDVRISSDVFTFYRSGFYRSQEKSKAKISIAKFKIGNVHAENISADLQYIDNTLVLDSIQSSLYGGRMQGSAVGKNLSDKLLSNWKWNIQFNHIEMKSLLTDISAENNLINITGSGQLIWQGELTGNNQDQVLRSLNGIGSFSVANGEIEGINLSYYLHTLDALLNKNKNNISIENNNRTPFNDLTGTFIIKNGVFETNNALLSSPMFSAKAKGNIVLNTRELDFQLQIKPLLLTMHSDVEVPILITGKLNHPNVRLDMPEIKKELAKTEMNQIKEEVVKQVKKHVHGRAGEFVQQLLGS